MINTKRYLNDLVNLILASFLSLSLVYAKTASLMFDINPLKLYLMILVFLLVFYLVFYNRLTLKITLAVLGFSLVCALIYLIVSKSFSRLVFELISFASWTLNYIQDIIPVNPSYKLYITIIICMVVTLFVFLFTVRSFNFLFISLYGIVFFIGQWCFKYFESYPAFYLFIVMELLFYFRHVYSKKSLREFNDYISQPRFIFWMLPICVIILSLAVLIPSDYKTKSGNWVDKSIDHIYSFFNRTFNSYKVFEYFSLDSAGFNEANNKLGGKVRFNKTLVLKVDSPRVTYLKGSCKEIYTGSSWLNGKKKVSPVILDYDMANKDYFEMTTGLRLLTEDPIYMNKYFYDDNVTVTYQNMMTKSLFIPAKFVNLQIEKTSLFKGYIEQNGIISSKKVMGKNFSYSMNVFNPRFNSKEFQSVLRQSRIGLYDDIRKKINIINKEISAMGAAEPSVSPEFSADTEIDFSYSISYKDLTFIMNNQIDRQNGSFPIPPELAVNIKDLEAAKHAVSPSAYRIGSITAADLEELSKMAEVNYKNYLQLPKSLPLRVRDLAYSITSSAQTNYDKVKAIEKYLSTNYPYTLSPKSTPPGRDFVDYFLFDLKEGYCVYYASAMTTLVRSIGIPARYVEGYVLPPRPDNRGIYNVTNEQAHAWVEVYLEGFGWMPFEPTSPYVSAFYNNGAKALISSSMAYDSYYSEYLRRLQQYNSSGYTGPLDEAEASEKKHPGSFIYPVVSVILLVLFLASVSIILFNLARHRISLTKFASMPPKEGVLALYRYYAAMLKAFGIPIRPGETAYQYAERVDAFLLLAKPDNFKAVTAVFVTARYSRSFVPSVEERNFVMEFGKKLEYRIGKEFGKHRFFFYRYLLGRMYR